MAGHATAGDLLRGDTITGIEGRTISPETVTRVETAGDDVAVTTKRGPQRRTTVRHLPATTPVTTDPPLPHWRFTTGEQTADTNRPANGKPTSPLLVSA